MFGGGYLFSVSGIEMTILLSVFIYRRLFVMSRVVMRTKEKFSLFVFGG